MDFGEALNYLKSGHRVCREGWNGKGLFLVLFSGSQKITVEENRFSLILGLPVGAKFKYLPHIDLKTVEGDFIPWTASQADILAEDWQVVN